MSIELKNCFAENGYIAVNHTLTMMAVRYRGITNLYSFFGSTDDVRCLRTVMSLMSAGF